MVTIIPAHWISDSFSENIRMAPIKVQTGPVALIGDTMVSGRCFNAKNANTQELTTITDLIKTKACSLGDTTGKYKPKDCIASGSRNEYKKTGIKMITEVEHDKSKTGNTALSFTDVFLNTS